MSEQDKKQENSAGEGKKPSCEPPKEAVNQKGKKEEEPEKPGQEKGDRGSSFPDKKNQSVPPAENGAENTTKKEEQEKALPSFSYPPEVKTPKRISKKYIITGIIAAVAAIILIVTYIMIVPVTAGMYKKYDFADRQCEWVVKHLPVEKVAEALLKTDSRLLYVLGERGREAVPYLTEALNNSKDAYTRGAAATALYEIGPDAEAAIDSLIRALKDDQAYVRMISAMVLGRMRTKAKKATRHMIPLLQDKSHYVRMRTAYALEKIGDPSVIPYVREARNKEVKKLAMIFMHLALKKLEIIQKGYATP